MRRYTRNICFNHCRLEQILKKELEIFEMLDYNLGFPMSIQFLRRYSKTGYEVVDGTQEMIFKNYKKNTV